MPATIIGESRNTLYGIGVWVSGSPPGKGKLHVILDDMVEVKFERVTGFDPGDPPEPIKETVRLTSGKQFFGVVAPQGFTKFQLLEVEGILEDQVLMWAADFTFAGVRLVTGDVNGDGFVNGLDVGPFVALVLSGEFQAEADCNWDSAVNGLDVQPFVDLVLTGGEGTTAVPEPSTLNRAAVGLPALLVRSWWRRRRVA